MARLVSITGTEKSEIKIWDHLHCGECYPKERYMI
jgi:hypothetical protein